MATSGLGPASVRASANAMGLLSMRSTASSVPASSSRTINDRARCRSTAAYCRFTGPLLVRSRVGLATSSVSLERFRAGEDRPFVLVAAIASLRQLAAAGALSPSPSARARRSLCHAITYELADAGSGFYQGPHR